MTYGLEKNMECPAEITLRVVGGRWKIPILFHLFQGVKRFSELRHAIGGISQKVLTQQLRELERRGIILRKVYPQVPPRVEYSLTEIGETLKPLIDEMCQWGVKFEKGALNSTAEMVVDGPSNT
ncbi:MAG: helix-turn-helix transcriptional regulator [Blastocatellia bacterium]|nr:helix-turn-helix transcriptional regulator [Blastocatellia bacterium]